MVYAHIRAVPAGDLHNLVDELMHFDPDVGPPAPKHTDLQPAAVGKSFVGPCDRSLCSESDRFGVGSGPRSKENCGDLKAHRIRRMRNWTAGLHDWPRQRIAIRSRSTAPSIRSHPVVSVPCGLNWARRRHGLLTPRGGSVRDCRHLETAREHRGRMCPELC